MYIRNKIGPRTLPCGSLSNIFLFSASKPLIHLSRISHTFLRLDGRYVGKKPKEKLFGAATQDHMKLEVGN